MGEADRDEGSPVTVLIGLLDREQSRGPRIADRLQADLYERVAAEVDEDKEDDDLFNDDDDFDDG